MIGLLDYGLGNIQAFINVYQRLHIPVKIISSSNDMLGVTRLILPGVGHFDQAMQLFNRSGLKETVEIQVLEKKIPILGICVGMQMLAISSDEGQEKGLGWIKGQVKGLDTLFLPNDKLPLPHMGWNSVYPAESSPLFRDFDFNDSRFYFLHSYYFDCNEDISLNIGTVSYGKPFCCAVASGNIFGVQFHPEKSHSFGERLLKNFAELSLC